jgi:hypothetical protein
MPISYSGVRAITAASQPAFPVDNEIVPVIVPVAPAAANCLEATLIEAENVLVGLCSVFPKPEGGVNVTTAPVLSASGATA